jgi:spermidine synthase
VLILRELLVAFQGNELLLGLFLGNWLLLEAVGTGLARAGSDRTTRPVEGVALLQLVLGLAPVAGILLVRSFKAALGISTGEVLGIPWAWLVSAAVLAPVAAADGAAFPFGCRALADMTGKERAAGRAYCLSAAGSVLGGLLFLVPFLYALSPLHLSALLCLASVASALGLLATCGAAPGIRRLALGLLAGVALAVTASVPGRLDAWSARLQWYDHSLLQTAHSPYSMVAVVRSAEQYSLFVNGSPYAALPHPGPEVEILAHFPMLLHDHPRRILVVGGGAGGLVRELLKHPMEEIAYAEQDPLILETLRRLPTPLTIFELTHPKVRTHPVEGRLFLRQAEARWDLILLNLPVPATLMLNRYYTLEFFELARRRLAEAGVLAFVLPGSETLLAPELAALNGTVHAALRAAFRHVRVLAGDPNLFIASDGEGRIRAWDPQVLATRLEERGIRAGLITDAYIHYRMDRERFAHLLQAIGEGEVVNRDGFPRGTFASMRLFSRVVSPPVARMLAVLDRVPAAAYVAGAIALIGGLLAVQVRWRKPLYVGFAATSTGFAGMVMSVVLILAFQVQYGDVYQYVGVLTALFMLGAAAGSAWAASRGAGPLPAIESALLLTLLLAYGCGVWGPPADVWLGLIFSFMVLTGIMTGAQYPVLVARLRVAHGGIGAPAGKVYVLDLAGAILGAALAGIVLVPTIGLAGTILLTVVLKAGSLVLILAWQRRPAAPDWPAKDPGEEGEPI